MIHQILRILLCKNFLFHCILSLASQTPIWATKCPPDVDSGLRWVCESGAWPAGVCRCHVVTLWAWTLCLSFGKPSGWEGSAGLDRPSGPQGISVIQGSTVGAQLIPWGLWCLLGDTQTCTQVRPERWCSVWFGFPRSNPEHAVRGQ